MPRAPRAQTARARSPRFEFNMQAKEALLASYAAKAAPLRALDAAKPPPGEKERAAPSADPRHHATSKPITLALKTFSEGANEKHMAPWAQARAARAAAPATAAASAVHTRERDGAARMGGARARASSVRA